MTLQQHRSCIAFLLLLLLLLQCKFRITRSYAIFNGGRVVTYRQSTQCWKQQQQQQQDGRMLLLQQQLSKYNNNDDYDDDDSNIINDGLAEIRRLLEDAWNIPMMGRIPTSPNNAVDECVDAMRRLLHEQAQQQQQSDVSSTTSSSNINNNNNSNNNVYFIDILLPQYDITYGSKVYDEILIAEFCINFVNQLQIPSVIVFKNDTSVNTITRILNKRMGTTNDNESSMQVPVVEYNDFDDTSVNVNSIDNENEINIGTIDNDITEYDDTDPSIANFRKSLMQSWDISSSSSTSTNATSLYDDERIPIEERLLDDIDTIKRDIIEDTTGTSDSTNTNIETNNNKKQQYHRIASLFGSSIISKGSDMIDDVKQAIMSNQGLPYDHEQMIMIVSAISKEEMYAVRAIVNKYNNVKNKMIVFINCKLQPIPQELIRGQTIYSILPFVAQLKESKSASSSKSINANNNVVPKVVVLRRYPHNWEIFINLGRGFDIVTSVSDNDRTSNSYQQQQQQQNQRGPSMNWIQTMVQQYIQRYQQQHDIT